MFFIVCGVVLLPHKQWHALENPLPSRALSRMRVGIFFSRTFRSHGRTKKDSVCLPFKQTTRVEIFLHKHKTLIFKTVGEQPTTISKPAKQTKKVVEKSYLLKSQPMFFVASHTEWREPSDFSTGISAFSCNK